MSNTITIDQLKSLIKKESGKSLRDLSKESQASKDADGCCKEIKITNGLFVKYVTNRNYQGGLKNGYGCGLYALYRNCGLGVQTLKLG